MSVADTSMTDWPYASALVVANPISGRGQGARAAEELQLGLREAGVAAELFLTGARGDAMRHLRERPDLDLVVSVGGDGTLREVLEGLVDPQIPVGLLPFGTANVLAHYLELPRDVPSCLEILRSGRTQALDAQLVNGHLSFLVTGVGLDGAIVHEVERRRRGPITRWSYLAAFLGVLRRYPKPRLRVVVDGRPIPGELGLALISNLPVYAGVLRLDPESRIDDGQVEVYTASRKGLLALGWSFARGLVRGFPGGGITMHRGSHITVESLDDPVPCQVDGDAAGNTPIELAPAPNRYRLVVP